MSTVAFIKGVANSPESCPPDISLVSVHKFKTRANGLWPLTAFSLFRGGTASQVA